MRIRLGRRGFRRIDLLVIVVIVALVIALLLPSISVVRISANRTKTQDALKNIVIAAIHAHEARKKLPPSYGSYGRNTASVLAHLIPFVEDEDIFSDPNPGRFRVSLFVSPSDSTAGDGLLTIDGEKYGAASYGWNDECSSLKMPEDFADGTSRTVLLTEKVARCGAPGTGPYPQIQGGNIWWQYPVSVENGTVVGPYYSPVLVGPKNTYKIDPASGLLPQFATKPTACDPFRAGTVNDVIQVAFADGSVRSFSGKIGQPEALSRADLAGGQGKKSVWLTLLTPAGDDNKDEENEF